MTLLQMIPIYCNLTLTSLSLWTETSAHSKQLKINTKPSNVKPIVIYSHRMQSHFFIQPLKALLNNFYGTQQYLNLVDSFSVFLTVFFMYAFFFYIYIYVYIHTYVQMHI